jgi:dimethylargininase
MPLPKPTHALVREPSPRYAGFYAARGIPIDENLAHRQHEAYVHAIEQAGLKVTTLAAHPTLPDCVFIEDTAIVWCKRALITRIASHREGEQQETRNWLASNGFEIIHLPPGARIEGGDVMHLEDQTYVGLTERTNPAGVEALREFLSPARRTVIAVPVTRCLHLKSAMTYLGNQTVLVSSKLIDVDLPRGYARLEVPAPEQHAGNALRLNESLLFAAGFPQTSRLLRGFVDKQGCNLIELEISEYQKGEGAITCSSITLE